MDRPDYDMTLRLAYHLAFAVRDLKLSDALASADFAEAIGPILDPTLYRDKGRALADDMAILRAALDFQRAVRDHGQQQQQRKRQPEPSFTTG
jgi:hypothetical protein